MVENWVQIVEDDSETGCMLHPLPPGTTGSILQGDDNEGIDEHTIRQPNVQDINPRVIIIITPVQTKQDGVINKITPNGDVRKSRMINQSPVSDQGMKGTTVCKQFDRECQPTSSCMKVEDLVTDEDDCHHEEEHHIPIEPVEKAEPP